MRPAITAGQSGFTLIEVVVVLAIVGLVASFSLPAMIDLSEESAGDLEPARAMLLEAKRDAATGAVVEVVIAPTSGRYTVQSRRGEHVTAREGVISLGPVRTHGPDDRFRVVFRPVGIGVGDTLVGRSVSLLVEAGTGRVTIER